LSAHHVVSSAWDAIVSNTCSVAKDFGVPAMAVRCAPMEFTGKLFYDFTSPDVYRLAQLLAVAEAEGTRIQLEWTPFLAVPPPAGRLEGAARMLAAAEAVRFAAPHLLGGFIQAGLVAVHEEGEDVAGDVLLPLVLRAAHAVDYVDDLAIEGLGRNALERATAEAAELGVTAAPAFFRHGPVVHVRTTAAPPPRGARVRLQLIDGVLEDDGIWELRKP
jgi:predicted DsbA family dithiol-disulfide isomerase